MKTQSTYTSNHHLDHVDIWHYDQISDLMSDRVIIEKKRRMRGLLGVRAVMKKNNSTSENWLCNRYSAKWQCHATCLPAALHCDLWDILPALDSSLTADSTRTLSCWMCSRLNWGSVSWAKKTRQQFYFCCFSLSLSHINENGTLYKEGTKW